MWHSHNCKQREKRECLPKFRKMRVCNSIHSRYAVNTSSFSVCYGLFSLQALRPYVTRRWLVLRYGRFGTANISHLQGSNSLIMLFWVHRPLNKAQISYPETSVTNPQPTLRNTQQKRSVNTPPRSLQSRNSHHTMPCFNSLPDTSPPTEVSQ
jgi:hypothetical protein